MITPSTRFYGLRMNLRSATRDRNHEARRSEAQPLWEPRSRTDRAAEQAGALALAAGGARDAADRAQAPGGADHLDLVAAASLGAVEGGVGGRHEFGVLALAARVQGGHPDRHRDVHPLAAGRAGGDDAEAGDGGPDPFGDPEGVDGPGLWQQDGELLAAETR